MFSRPGKYTISQYLCFAEMKHFDLDKDKNKNTDPFEDGFGIMKDMIISKLAFHKGSVMNSGNTQLDEEMRQILLEEKLKEAALG